MAYCANFLGTEPARAELEVLPEALVIEFGVPWCGHCQAAQPLVMAAFAAYPQVRHFRVEDGRGRPLGRSFRVKLWPTLVFLRGGVEVARLVRPTTAAAIVDALTQIADA